MPSPHLETARFVLRCLAASDNIEPLQSWLADPAIMAPLNMPARMLAPAEIAAYIGSFDNQDRYLLGVFSRSDRRQIGFWIVEINALHRTATWHTAVGEKSHWGQAATVEAGIALLDWLFGERGIEKVIGTSSATNEKVLHRYQSTGWRLEGILKGELRSVFDGSRIDQYRFGLLKEEWPEVRTRALGRLEMPPS